MNDTQAENRPLTRKETGRAVFEFVKSGLVSRGYNLTSAAFDPSYPLSLRTLQDMRNGKFTESTLQKIPGIEVSVLFSITFKHQASR